MAVTSLKKFSAYNIEITVFIIALALRTIVLLELTHIDPIPVRGDMGTYYWQAVGLQAGSWPPADAFYFHPLMPVLIYFSFLLFGTTPLSGQIFMVLVSSLACAVFTRAVINWYGSRAGMLAGLLAAVYQASVFYAHILLDVAFTSLVVSVMLWYLSLPVKRATATVIFGVMLGLGVLGRGTLVALVVSGAIYLWVYHRKHLLLYAAAVSLCLLPIVIRNSYYGHPGLSTGTAQNFWIGNNPYSKGFYLFPEGSVEKAEMQRLQGHYFEAGLNFIQTQPLNWGLLQLQKTALFLFAPDGFIPEQGHLWSEGIWHFWLLFLLPANWLFDVLAIAGLITTNNRRRFMPLLWVWLPYTAITLAFFYGTRFRVPLEFIPITITSVTLLELKDRTRISLPRPLKS